VLFVSSVRVEPDVLGVVEVWAVSMDTEKQNAAAVVISLFMVFVSCGIRTKFAYTYEDAGVSRQVFPKWSVNP
jgi:putative effector of murein hydrolase LrgA (UPF0299 family)